MASMTRSTRVNAFTIIELLVVISIISLLTAILIPALAAVKNSSKMVLCKSNLRQLVLANQNYANDYHGYSVPGAFNLDVANLHRWYGTRPSTNDPFDPTKGPLAPYLEQIQLQCPQKVYYTDLPPSSELYEDGNGGYGYNFTYVGSQIWSSGLETPDTSKSAKLIDIQQPQHTLLFTDTAFAGRTVITTGFEFGPALIRYSFAEPRYFVIGKIATSAWDPTPSIHFRHRKRACVGWADGHADAQKRGNYDKYNEDGIRPADFNVGWFEPMDNSLFDLN
jgi:prepilin-type N-terminal cleavage/methylation domain-containing protein